MEKHLGEMLDQLVSAKKGLTKEQFAKEIGISEPTLYKIFRSPDLESLTIPAAKKACDLLGIPYMALFDTETADFKQAQLEGQIQRLEAMLERFTALQKFTEEFMENGCSLGKREGQK